jgi:GDP-mannose 6-dehydrogenase
MAEICKYLDNTFHALKVVFANEVGAIAKNMDIDSQRLMEVFCEDKKMNISSYYLRPGFSFGGSCLPKDVKGMNHIAKNLGLETPIISSIIASNDSHTNRALELVKSSGFKNLGFVGIAFKEDTDDIRGNPIISVINSLCENKKNIIWLYDSLAKIDNIFDGSNVFVTNQIDELIEKSEVIILSNRTAEYRAKVLSSKKPIIDLNKSVYKECESICLV